jgi:hypothetical protein
MKDALMTSLFDELSGKLEKDPRLTKRSGPRADLGLLMFNARDDVSALWKAAEAEMAAIQGEGRMPSAELVAAIDALRPIFGERSAR